LAELETQANELGGQNIDAIVGRMMERVTEKGEFREAVFRLVYRSVAAGMVSAPADLPEIALEEDVDWQMMDVNAYSFAETYTYDLVTGINQTTERGLRNALTRWIEEGGTLDELTESIRPVFANEAATRRIESLFKVDRARMIAATEATRAYVQGTVQYWVAQGFAMPREAPPKHPNCRCDIAIKKDEFGNYWWVWFTAKDERVCPLCNPYILNPQISIAKAAEPKEVEAADKPVTELDNNGIDPEVYALIEAAEANLRKHKKYEVGLGFSVTGQQLFRKKGTLTQIQLTHLQKTDLRRQIFTHNHPEGRSFSTSDVVCALVLQMREMRTVSSVGGKNYLYSLGANETVWDWTRGRSRDEITRFVDGVYEEVKLSTTKRLNDGEITYDEANHMYSHWTMLRLVERFREEGVTLNYYMKDDK
jgi:hypothetical protein